MIRTRVFAASLEVREDGDGRTVTGIAVPFDEPTVIFNEDGQERFTETFARGSIVNLGEQSELTADHPRHGGELPIGVSVSFTETGKGVLGHWRVSKTSFGDDVLTLVKDGAVTGLSIGFTASPAMDSWSGDRQQVLRRGARLDHTALVRRGAYAGAQVLAVRHGLGQHLAADLAVQVARYQRLGWSLDQIAKATGKELSNPEFHAALHQADGERGDVSPRRTAGYVAVEALERRSLLYARQCEPDWRQVTRGLDALPSLWDRQQ